VSTGYEKGNSFQLELFFPSINLAKAYRFEVGAGAVGCDTRKICLVKHFY
jgi:hypothetical protein